MTSATPRPASDYPPGGDAFRHRHLTGIAQLTPWEISYILDAAEEWVELNRSGAAKHDDRLKGLTIINAFFENSTRTLLSFEIAGKRLGADVVNMHAAQSSVKKGETLIDTAMTLNAMRADAMVIRHASSGAVQLIADKVDCPVLNAGDGRHEHPTQALLDALTIRRRLGRVEGLTIAICGDVLHSRVARSNILALTLLGNEVRVVAPPTLTPPAMERMLSSAAPLPLPPRPVSTTYGKRAPRGSSTAAPRYWPPIHNMPPRSSISVLMLFSGRVPGTSRSACSDCTALLAGS